MKNKQKNRHKKAYKTHNFPQQANKELLMSLSKILSLNRNNQLRGDNNSNKKLPLTTKVTF